MMSNIEHRKYMLPNIFTYIDHDKPKLVHIKVPLKIQEVICKLAIKYPDFTFVSKPFISKVDDTIADEKATWIGTFTDFKVTSAEGDELGTICCSSETIFIRGKRVQQMRSYKQYIQTVDVKRAIAQASKVFKPPEVQELLTSTSEDVNDKLRRLNYEASEKYETTFRREIENNRTKIMDNFEAIIKSANLSLEGELARLPEYRETAHLVENMFDMYKANKGYVVQIKGKRYLVAGARGDNPEYFMQEKLDNHIKKCVGMLKLVEDDVSITGIGLRLNEFEFYIMPEGGKK